MASSSVIRIKPLFYVHVLDNNTNITRVETGPQTFTKLEHEKIMTGPEPMIMVPPRHYVVISNPVLRDAEGEVKRDDFTNYVYRHGDEEMRFEQDPFPLYPGEKLQGKINPLTVVEPDSALRLRCQRDFTDENQKKYVAGDEWLFRGPATYIPRVEVSVAEIIKATVLKENQALRLKARRDCVDYQGIARKAGDEWLVRITGAYLPDVDEEVVSQVINARVLTEKKALHMRAIRTFTDAAKVERKAGQEWLITFQDEETHIPDVDEEIVGEVTLLSLSNRQYCVILDPVNEKGEQQFGTKELRRGEISFFLKPGEKLEAGIQNVHVLGEEEALLLRAREAFQDGKTQRAPGSIWRLDGPTEYVPPVTVEILETRRKIPLDENEGIYIRDRTTGKVRMEQGRSYMLQPDEELWEKELPKLVEDLLVRAVRSPDDTTKAIARDKTKVVSYRAPHNTAVQIYDYKMKKARVVFGPDLVMLGPDEHFTVLSLSGGKPKQSDKIKSLCLMLGPDFMTDIVIVETSDHARLSLQLSYNWHFNLKAVPDDQIHKIFAVQDFVGDACKAIASRVRGSVASVSFDHFHKKSADLITAAVFGRDDNGAVRESLNFSANFLTITNIDIQSVEPVDQRTRDSLQKSVQLAIEITTKSQEASAKREAECSDQKSKGQLETQKIKNEAAAEKERMELLVLQAESATVEAAGQATAEARAKARAAEIEGEATLQGAEQRAKATKIREQQNLDEMTARHSSEVDHLKALSQLEIKKARDLAAIEAKKFKDIVGAIGAETIKDIAQAGPELQLKLLQGLGLQSFLITDGNSPINLFQTANGLVQGAGQ